MITKKKKKKKKKKKHLNAYKFYPKYRMFIILYYLIVLQYII